MEYIPVQKGEGLPTFNAQEWLMKNALKTVTYSDKG